MVRADQGPAQRNGDGPLLVEKVRRPVKARQTANFAVPVIVALALLGGCARGGEVTPGGITAIRTACPAVAIPAATGDITLFNRPDSVDQSALDMTALLTDVRSTCSDMGENVHTNVTFQIRALRTDTSTARDVTLPFFITVVQGGTAVVAKRIGHATLHFDAGVARATTTGEAAADVNREAATLSKDIRKSLTKPRKAGEEDAAIDPLARPEIREAVRRATFEALVGFQLTDAQLKYNATR